VQTTITIAEMFRFGTADGVIDWISTIPTPLRITGLLELQHKLNNSISIYLKTSPTGKSPRREGLSSLVACIEVIRLERGCNGIILVHFLQWHQARSDCFQRKGIVEIFCVQATRRSLYS